MVARSFVRHLRSRNAPKRYFPGEKERRGCRRENEQALLANGLATKFCGRRFRLSLKKHPYSDLATICRKLSYDVLRSVCFVEFVGIPFHFPHSAFQQPTRRRTLPRSCGNVPRADARAPERRRAILVTQIRKDICRNESSANSCSDPWPMSWFTALDVNQMVMQFAPSHRYPEENWPRTTPRASWIAPRPARLAFGVAAISGCVLSLTGGVVVQTLRGNGRFLSPRPSSPGLPNDPLSLFPFSGWLPAAVDSLFHAPRVFAPH